jgi:hypothetical protein
MAESAQVERARTFQGLPWKERVALGDDRLDYDDLALTEAGPLRVAHTDLGRALRLVEALSRGKAPEINKALADFQQQRPLWVGERPADSFMAPDWRAVVRGPTPADGWLMPFEDHSTRIDWPKFGLQFLTKYLHDRLVETSIGVGLKDGRLALGWMVGSLLDVIHLQLFDHLQRRAEFGVGKCDYCGAPILRVRHEQHWHSGCAPAGRQRESRAARKAARNAEAST